MNRSDPNSSAAPRVTVAVVMLAAIGAVFASGEIEVYAILVATVIAGLVCFDAAMGEKAGSFWPWVALSMAPVAKAVPTVWGELRTDSAALFERYEHVGSLLFGVFVLVAVVLLARPADTLGTRVEAFDFAVIAGAAATAGLAGTSVAFLYDRDFGSVATARALESSTWIVIGGLLAATAIAASHARVVSATLGGLLLFAAAVAGFLAVSVAGADLDRGWWAVLFALLTANAALNQSRVGYRAERDRRSNIAVGVALIAGIVAAGAAITARSDRDSWGPGWALLGVLSLGLFLLALASRPLDEQHEHALAPSKPADNGIDSDRAVLAKARASESIGQLPSAAFGRLTGTNASATTPPRDRVPLPAASSTRPAGQATADAVNAAAAANAHQEIAAQPQAEPARSAQPDDQGLSDVGIVASARDAAAVRTAPHPKRHSLAPLAQAHHFDPSTGLLSAAGLQHAIARAFDVQRKAGHVTILLFMIRDLDQIEREHGRLVSAAVTREVADRVRTVLADGTGARFARSAYAVVFVGDRSNAAETIQSMAQVLLRLRAPVDAGAIGFQIDVVAGMAQCYEGENAAEFVQRANQGLARAVQATQPSLVAMP